MTSFIKIGIGFFLVGLNLFVFLVVGETANAESGMENQLQVDTSVPLETEEPAFIVTTVPPLSNTEPVTLDDIRRPQLEDYAHYAGAYIYEVGESYITTTSVTTTPPPVVTTTTTAVTTTTPPVNTTSATTQTTPQELPPPAVGNLTVYDQRTASYITGSALDIISSIVMAEGGSFTNDEVIKAQAVASYSYILFHKNLGNTPSVVLKNPSERVKRLVGQVLGEVVYYNNKPANTVYHSASAKGTTSTSLTVWKVNYPYLTSVSLSMPEVSDNINYGFAGVQLSYSSSQMKNIIYQKTGISLTGNPEDWFEIVSYVDDVYVGTLSIGGHTSYSGKTITGRVFRETIMDFKLRSSSFDIVYDAGTDTFVITTYGYGHGVGMSQYGANYLAEYKGYTYKQILEFFYKGCEVY